MFRHGNCVADIGSPQYILGRSPKFSNLFQRSGEKLHIRLSVPREDRQRGHGVQEEVRIKVARPKHNKSHAMRVDFDLRWDRGASPGQNDDLDHGAAMKPPKPDVVIQHPQRKAGFRSSLEFDVDDGRALVQQEHTVGADRHGREVRRRQNRRRRLRQACQLRRRVGPSKQVLLGHRSKDRVQRILRTFDRRHGRWAPSRRRGQG